MPRSLPSPPRFVRLFSFFFCLGLFFRGKSRLTGVPSPLWARLIPDKEADWWSDRVKLLFVPGCTRNVRIIIKKYRKHTHTHRALEAPRLWFMLFPFISLFVWERTPWQSAHPEFDSLKKRSTLRLSSAVWSHQSVMFNLMAKCFGWANFSLGDSCEWNARIVYIWPVICGKKNKSLNRALKKNKKTQRNSCVDECHLCLSAR